MMTVDKRYSSDDDVKYVVRIGRYGGKSTSFWRAVLACFSAML